MLNDFLSKYNWIISLVIQTIIAYHVYALSQKISNKSRLEHKEIIKKIADELLSKIRSKRLNCEVHLVNINRYFKDYPSNTEKRFESYSHIRAEIKSTRYDGIEFFAESPREVYQKPSGKLSFKGGRKDRVVFNAYPIGIVPYEWIEHIDINGDEFAYVPQFFCYYKGKTHWEFWKRLLFYGYPYKKLIYYRLNESYDENRQPDEMKYIYVDEPIS